MSTQETKKKELLDVVKKAEEEGGTVLSLSNNKIGDEEMKELAPFLSQMTQLYKLDLHNNKIGDEGIKALAPCLSQMTHLQQLNLEDNNISVQGASILTACVKDFEKGCLIRLPKVNGTQEISSFQESSSSNVTETVKEDSTDPSPTRSPPLKSDSHESVPPLKSDSHESVVRSTSIEEDDEPEESKLKGRPVSWKEWCCGIGHAENFNHPWTLRETCCGSIFHQLFGFATFGIVSDAVNTLLLFVESSNQQDISWPNVFSLLNIAITLVIFIWTLRILRTHHVLSFSILGVAYCFSSLLDILNMIFPAAFDGHTPQDIPWFYVSGIFGLLSDVWVAYLFLGVRKDVKLLKALKNGNGPTIQDQDKISPLLQQDV